MKKSGGIILLFSLVITFTALGILFLLNSTATSNLQTAANNYVRTQLISNIRSGNTLIENVTLPAFNNEGVIEIETIESGTIQLKRLEKKASRYHGQYTFANLGAHDHFKQIQDQFTISFWMKPQNPVFVGTGIRLPSSGEPVLGFSQRRSGNYPGAGFQFAFDRIDENTVARLVFLVTLVEEDEIADHSALHSLGFDDIIDSEWIFVTVVYNGNQLRIFRNEEVMEQINVSGNVDWSTIANGSFFVGKYVNTPAIGGSFFSGQIRNVGLWNSAMNNASVGYMHQQGLNFNPLINFSNYASSDQLLGFWKMNDGTGSYVLDYSIYSNNGGIINRNASDQCWTAVTDSFTYIISSEFNEFQRSENLR
jgi:hypothetical protein|tara:strand:+ start:428 stop:1525 length:1098 start_codon:yes stop_codon:yes gene_type:complete